MFFRILALVLATALFGRSAVADGWYLGLQAGGSFVDDSVVSDITGVGEATFAAGYSVAGSVGYDFSEFGRVEWEVGYAENEVDEIQVAGFGFPAAGNVNAVTLMLNAFIELPTGGSSFKPYVGGGVGGARVTLDNVSATGGTFVIDDDDTAFAWQVGFGIRYAAFVIDYRYFTALGLEFTQPSLLILTADYDRHTIRMGLHFRF